MTKIAPKSDKFTKSKPYLGNVWTIKVVLEFWYATRIAIFCHFWPKAPIFGPELACYPIFFSNTRPKPVWYWKKTYPLGPGYQAYPGKTLPTSLCHHYSYPTSPFSWGGGAKLHPSSLLTRSLLQAVVAISKMFINSCSIQNLRDQHSGKIKAKPQSI